MIGMKKCTLVDCKANLMKCEPEEFLVAFGTNCATGQEHFDECQLRDLLEGDFSIKLLKAAPALLAVCKEVLGDLGVCSVHREKLRAAVAEAVLLD